ncbi:hypothetical protein DCAR_0417693 [Daucus carota subsp. sativus]|uniref:UVR domain-containing protein n=1 Tax=Daucus carota subsp. sativus TaxID=79200 RepID=A0AAF0WYU2_DAUCS|nr:PREDICTED: uncharacterized protein PFB0145c [Daucus carota subsp. sativus]WOG98352.1 hypothetical protein DCAR_0417693 [Daucus carota subsp. sativus]
MESDDMDSLFEGMVLFDPSQPSLPPSSTQQSTPIDNSSYDSKHHQNHQPEPTDPPAPELASQPLDENLFSDLTLVTPQIQQTLAEPSPIVATAPIITKSITRQVSNTRKKKRAAGLRIGYKKDDLDSVVDSVVTARSSSVPEEEIRISEVENRDREVEAIARTVVDSNMVQDMGEKPDVDNDLVRDVGEKPDVDNGLVRDGGEKPDVDTIGEEEDRKSEDCSIERRFEKIRSEIMENLKRARERVDSVSQMRKECIRRRRKAAEDLSMASTKYRELERQLEEACEAEDFEMADRLSDSLASADSEKEMLAVALRDADAECDAVDVKMQGVLDLQIAAEEECVSLLQRFSMDAAKDADLVLRNAELMSSKEINQWDSSVELAEVKRMELDAESFIVNEARLALNESVDHLVEDEKRELEILHREKEVLTDELERLLALVKQKESEIKENESSIEKVEKRITNAVSSFQEAQSSINAKYNNLLSELSQMELQNESLSRKKEEVDECFSQEQGRAAKIQNLAKTSADEANMYQEVAVLRKKLIQFILRTREHKLMLAKTGDKLTEDVQMLKQDISNGRASLQELSTTKTSIQQEIESFKQRLLFIDKRIPELEAEKKVAASVRNFKEAARLAAEVKALCVEKEGIQTKMEGALSELGKFEGEILDTVNRLQDTEAHLLSKEKELAMTRFQILLLIAGAATSEKSAALQLGDVEEGEILLGEAEVAESEARKLQSTYNFKEAEFDDLPKHFISMELVSNLEGKKLVELAATAHIPAP